MSNQNIKLNEKLEALKPKKEKYIFECANCKKDEEIFLYRECDGPQQLFYKQGLCNECFDRLLKGDRSVLSGELKINKVRRVIPEPTKEEIERLEKLRLKNRAYSEKRKEYLKEIEPLLVNIKKDVANNLCFHIYDTEKYTNTVPKTLVEILAFFDIKLEREHLLRYVYKATLYEIKEKLKNKDTLNSFEKKFKNRNFYVKDGGLRYVQRYSKKPFRDNHKLFWI